MNNIKQFNSFKTSYKELKRNEDKRFLIEFYHYDLPSMPTISVLDNVTEVMMFFDEMEREEYITIRTLKDNTDIYFSKKSYNTNLSNGCVVFSSKNDDKTHCLISFPEVVSKTNTDYEK